jgi:hypothetical protein
MPYKVRNESIDKSINNFFSKQNSKPICKLAKNVMNSALIILKKDTGMISIMDALSDSKLLEYIESFNIKTITPKTIKRLRFITEQREFNAE